MNAPVTPKDYLIDRLRALCAASSVEDVATAAKVSAENLQQIVNGTLLPSGAPRGVIPPIGCKVGPCVCDKDGNNCQWTFVCS